MLRAAMCACVAVALIGAGAARATERDCARPDDASARLICADPALAAADARLTAAYQQALVPLSAAGRDAMQSGQSTWRGYLATLCQVDEPPAEDAGAPAKTPSACLEQQYALRQRQLAHATVSGSGLVIGRVDSFAATPALDHYRLAPVVVGYPRIDAPKGDSETRWNALMQSEAQKRATKQANGQTDVWIDYRIVAISPDLISTLMTDYQYGHGAAHGVTQQKTVNWLRRDGRELTTRDLFDDASGWRVGLARLCFAALQAKHARDHVDYTVRADSELRPIVVQPRRWTIERAGLGVQFIEYEIGAYAVGAPKLVIPWSELRPYLVKHPPAPAPVP